jgi:radical SAM protein with 4Fe4S-binding SPASM domain
MGFPSFVDLEISLGCNLRCPMCWLHGESAEGNRFVKQELTTAQAAAIIEDCGHYGADIYFGGGEPFFRKDFMTLLEQAGRAGIASQFTTNGTLIDDDRAAKIIEYGTRSIFISIDGDEASHDAIRGAGNFRKTCNTVRRIAQARRDAGSLTPSIGINMTLNRQFAGRLKSCIDEVVEATGDEADTYRLHHLWFVGPNELTRHQAEVKARLGVSAEKASCHKISAPEGVNPMLLEHDIAALRSMPKVRALPELSPREIQSYYSEDTKSSGYCLASFQALVIKPNGDVVFCPDDWIDEFVLGNVKEQRLRDIWRGQNARQFRLAMATHGAFAGCKRCPWFRSNNPAHFRGLVRR